MAVSYKKLFKILIDRDMKKKDLCELAGVSPATITKLSNGENVTMEVIDKICTNLNCSVNDILEIIPQDLNTGANKDL
jgi:DNA-binding Xre family transcriptional regulator